MRVAIFLFFAHWFDPIFGSSLIIEGTTMRPNFQRNEAEGNLYSKSSTFFVRDKNVELDRLEALRWPLEGSLSKISGKNQRNYNHNCH